MKTFIDKIKNIYQKPLVSGLSQIFLVIGILYLVALWQQFHMLQSDQSIEAPTIRLPELNGGLVSINVAESGRPLLVYFFAPWCRICHFSIDTIESIHKDPDYKNIQILAIALDWQSKQSVETFVKEHQLSFPVALGTRNVGQQWKIQGYPSYYIVDHHGKIVSRDTGLTTKAGLLWRISNLL